MFNKFSLKISLIDMIIVYLLRMYLMAHKQNHSASISKGSAYQKYKNTQYFSANTVR